MTARSTSGRIGALLVSAALLASLAAATVASPVSAAKPRCDGKVATIVSKKGIIRGTAKNDVIVAVGARDNRIYGRGGHDRICAGKGHDIVYGGAGRDRIFGAAGQDRLYGGPADDLLAGGPGVDLCAQGTGTGPRPGCERPLVQAPAPTPAPTPPPPAPTPEPTPEPKPSADLKTTVTGADEIPFWGNPSFGVTVTNLGPTATAYVLSYDFYWTGTTETAGCGIMDDASGPHASLDPGASREHRFTMWEGCYSEGESLEFLVKVESDGSTEDPNVRNNVGRKVMLVGAY